WSRIWWWNITRGDAAGPCWRPTASHSPRVGRISAAQFRRSAAQYAYATPYTLRYCVLLLNGRKRALAELPSGLRAFPDGQAFLLQQALQLAGLEHLAHDIAAADEFALDVELRNGRPVGIGLDAVAQLVVLQDVEPFVGHA